MRSRTAIAALMWTVMLPLTAACGSDDAVAPIAKHTAGNGDVFNDADASFASALVQHDAAALVLVDLTTGHALSPDAQELADETLLSHAPEVEQLVTWLNDWDRPVPATMRDHVNAGHDDHETHEGPTSETGADLPGMPTTAQLADLAPLDGDAFEAAWLDLMAEHRRGALELADAQLEDGLFAPARTLAEEIENARTNDLETIDSLRRD